MAWYVVVGLILLGVFLYIIGFISAVIYCDKKISDKKTVGDLFITLPEHEPYLVAKAPMEEVAKETYILLEVKTVKSSQK